jgi:hypothetical protein
LPQDEDKVEYSGKFTLRIPKTFHRQLSEVSKGEGVSLNQYVQMLLAYGFGRKETEKVSNRITQSKIKVKEIGKLKLSHRPNMSFNGAKRRYENPKGKSNPMKLIS